MSTLISEGGYGCVYYPGISCDGKTTTDKRFVSKLQKKDFNSNNEILVSNIVKTITDYDKYFLPIKSSCPINIHKIDTEVVGECSVAKKTSTPEFLLTKINYLDNTPFFDMLNKTSNADERIELFSKILNTYKYLLNSIHLLLKKNIVHLDIKIPNILFSRELDVPIIIDFGISIPFDNLTFDNMDNYFYDFLPSYNIWPIDVHVINFLIHTTREPLTNEDVKYLVSKISEHNKELFMFFNDDYIELYQKNTVNYLERFVGEPRDKVIQTLLKYYYTWDNYSISVMTIQILQILYDKANASTHIVAFSNILLNNIDSNPEVRMTIEDTLQKFREVWYTIENVEDAHKITDNMI